MALQIINELAQKYLHPWFFYFDPTVAQKRFGQIAVGRRNFLAINHHMQYESEVIKVIRGESKLTPDLLNKLYNARIVQRHKTYRSALRR